MTGEQHMEDRGIQEQVRKAIMDTQGALGLRNGEFAEAVGVSAGTVTRWRKPVDDPGSRTPSRPEEIGALLRVAPPEQQAQLLEALGVVDVTQFAADLLASTGGQAGNVDPIISRVGCS